MLRKVALALVLVLVSALGAQAQESSYDEPLPPSELVTVSISPLHLFIPMLELQVELRLGELFGIAAIGGVGTLTVETSDGDQLSFPAQEVGGQLVFYPTEAFRNWQLGVEALLLRVEIDERIGSDRVTGLGAGLSAGPFLGYKWISDVGFSVFVQGGFTVAVVKSEATNDLGQSATVKENDLLLLLNVNVGWSF